MPVIARSSMVEFDTSDLNIGYDRVYVNASRVMRKVREVCEDFDEDISHACDPDLS